MTDRNSHRKRRAELDAGGSNLQLSLTGEGMETRMSMEEKTKESARGAALTLAELADKREWSDDAERNQALGTALDMLGIDWAEVRDGRQD